jgi:hypothetical protein
MKHLIWVTIPKYPGYEINEHLEIRRKSTGRIICYYSSDGYLKLNVSHLGKRYKPYLHQMVAWAFVPNPDNKPEIHHIDCDPLNNHWSNLQWVTKAEHRRLSKQNGQVAHKLKPSDVVFVRDNYSLENEQGLARKYDVSELTIYLIATGRARSDIKGGVIHEMKGRNKKVINIKTGEVFTSAEEIAVKTGINLKTLRRGLSGERYNHTSFRYLGEEHLAKLKPEKTKMIPFVSHSFGVIVSRKELVRSKNPRSLWKKVIQMKLDGTEVGTHESIREAARVMGGKDNKMLQKLLNGRKGKTYKGFKWKYA